MNESNSTKRRAQCMHWRAAWLALAFALSAGCAMPVRQLELQQSLVPATGQGFVLIDDAQCAIGTGYGRTLRPARRHIGPGTGVAYRSRFLPCSAISVVAPPSNAAPKPD